MNATRRRRLRLGFVVITVAGAALLAALSGFGVRYVKGTYAQVCDDEKTYLQAVTQGDLAEIASAVDQLKADLSFFRSDTRQYLTNVVDAASNGDPSLVRHDFRANCAPLPSPSATTTPAAILPGASVSASAASPGA